ncbi:nuclear transport factor 2 family protein [Massilia sp. DD77]|uniref:nuclear transport factor 2 family protein n=1 Tax=Massilia sp. DD77 TaxID=3109349 RepID=UPI002FFFBA6E
MLKVAKALALCATCLTGAPAGAANTDGSLRTTLVALEHERAEAISTGDVDSLRKLMDRSYLHVDSRGRVRSKADLLTRLDRQDMRFQRYDIESADVQRLDRDAAAVTGVFRSAMQTPEGAKPFRGRYVRVWVKGPDGWKNTFHQVTEIQPQR